MAPFSADLVPVVGDSLRDLQAAAAAGATPVLVRTGNGSKTEASLDGDLASIEVFDDLRGQDVGRQLLDKLVAVVNEQGKRIIPLCPYAKSVFDKDETIRDVLRG